MSVVAPMGRTIAERLGVSTVCFRQLELAPALERIAALGARAVDLVALRGLCEHISPDGDPHQLRAAVATVRASGLTPLALNADPQSFDEQDPAVVLDRVERLAEFCATVGAPLLILPGGALEPRTDDESSRLARVVEGSRRAEVIGLRYGVQVVIEAPHYLRLACTLEQADQLGAHLPLVFDTSHVAAGGVDPAEAFTPRAHQVAHVQLRDAVAGDIRRAIGHGSIDFTRFFDACESAGYEGAYVMELETRNSPYASKDDEVAAAREALLRAATDAASGQEPKETP
ncbi:MULTISPECIES: sugar phosphate isomerase/epimerase family protein [Streptomyces]|uniref:Sugar phosphate isomerase/epimerase family protein n=2 Tax=Streptomyces TaxID=1883 RepID=A0ABV9J888_9ACTN